MDKWPVFICYRQIDGTKTAERIFNLLKDQPVPIADVAGMDPPLLDVYFDQASSAGPSWKAIHRPHLEKSRAMIVVCSAGAYPDFRDDEREDWVHEEIDWWLDNNRPPPIPIDPLGKGLAWVPKKIKARWPDIQAIRVVEGEWDNLSAVELRAAEDRTRARLLGGIVPSGKSVYQQELEQEQERVRQLDIALELALTRLVQSHVDRGLRLMDESDHSVSLLWLTEALRLNRDPEVDLRIRQRIAFLLRGMPEIRAILRHDVQSDLSQSFDGQRFLRVEGNAVELIDLETRTIQSRFESTAGEIVDVALSPDGRYLSAITDDYVELWEIETNRPVFPPQRVKGRDDGYFVAFSPDSSKLVAVSEDERRARNQLGEDDTSELAAVQVWQIGVSPEATVFKPETEIFRPVFSSDSQRLLTATWPRAWQWKLPCGEDVTLPGKITTHFTSAIFSPDGRHLLTIEDDPFVRMRIRDPQSGEVTASETASTTNRTRDQSLLDKVVHGAYSGDGNRFVFVTENGQAHVLNASDLSPVWKLDVNPKPSKTSRDYVIPDATGNRLIVIRNNRHTPSEMRIWDVSSPDPLSPRITRPVSSLDAKVDGTGKTFMEVGGGVARWMKLPSGGAVETSQINLLSSSEVELRFDRASIRERARSYMIVDLSNSSEKSLSLADTQILHDVALSRDGNRVGAIVSTGDRRRSELIAYVWSAYDLSEIVQISLKKVKSVHGISCNVWLDASGQKLLVRVDDNLSMIDLADKNILWSRRNLRYWVWKQELRHEASIIVLGGNRSTCLIFNTATGTVLKLHRARHDDVYSYGIDGNGLYYFESDRDGVPVFSILDGKLGPLRMVATSVPIASAFIGPTSKRLYVSASGVTRIWSLETGVTVSDALIGGDVVTVSPDDKLLFTIDPERQGRIWETSTGSLVASGLWQDQDVFKACFDAKGERLRTLSRGGEVKTWALLPDPRPVDGMIALAQLYSQRRVTPAGTVVDLSPRELVALWNYYSTHEGMTGTAEPSAPHE